MSKKLTLEEFIQRANQIHNNKYDYSLVNYQGYSKKIKIICSSHGIIEILPSNHLQRKSGCSKCAWIGNPVYTLTSWIQKANIIHNNKYNYSLVEYKSSQKKVKIICPIHGEFNQIANDHIKGIGCPYCAGNVKITKNIFIKKSILKYNNLYDYSLVDYKDYYTPVIIICQIHGKFIQTPVSHINSSGCTICNFSKGEQQIRIFLIKNNIKFITQQRFKDCKNIKPLPFDFYLPDYNTCIEFDGPQHFNPISFSKTNSPIDSFNRTKFLDNIKTVYCNEKGIHLIRIPFYEIKNINAILEKELY